jgi:uncharacterized protein (DUF305 family)
MKNAIVAVTAVVVVAGVAVAVDRGGARHRPATTGPQLALTTAGLSQQLGQLHGEDFDRQFLADMIEHHNGAVDMAQQALTNARHQTLKEMAAAIVTAQATEVAEMAAWQRRCRLGFACATQEGTD